MSHGEKLPIMNRRTPAETCNIVGKRGGSEQIEAARTQKVWASLKLAFFYCTPEEKRSTVEIDDLAFWQTGSGWKTILKKEIEGIKDVKVVMRYAQMSLSDYCNSGTASASRTTQLGDVPRGTFSTPTSRNTGGNLMSVALCRPPTPILADVGLAAPPEQECVNFYVNN